jgi:tetrahydromethanopterin S-methyltransferase subunit B
MWIDTIVEETRKIREEHAAKFKFDLKAIYEDLKKQEQASDRKIVSLSPKAPVHIVEAGT